MFRYPSVVYNEIVNIKHKLWIRPWFWLINKIQFVADKKDETKLNYLLCSRDLCLCVWYWKLQSQRLPYQLLHHLLLPASGLHPADVCGDAAQAVEDLLLQCFKVKRKYFWKKLPPLIFYSKNQFEWQITETTRCFSNRTRANKYRRRCTGYYFIQKINLSGK